MILLVIPDLFFLLHEGFTIEGFNLTTLFDFQTTPSPFEDEEDQIYDEPPDGEEDGRSIQVWYEAF